MKKIFEKMKKNFEKLGKLRSLAVLMDVISLVLFIVAAFVEETTPDMILKLVGIGLFLVANMILALMSEEHRTFKCLLVFIGTTFLLTWLLPYGFYENSEFYLYEMKRVGIVDLGFAAYHSINFIMDKIVFLLAVAGFYGVLSKTSGYQKLVEKLAGSLKKHPAIAAVIFSVIIYVLTSLLTQTFIIIVFIPFIFSILIKMNLDKLTAFAITFGSALVAILGCTYGTDSLITFSKYITANDLTVGLTYRYIIAAVSLVLYNFFIVMRVRKITKETKKNTKNSVVEDDPFKVEGTKEKASMLPVIIILAILAIILILGYIDWKANFGIEIFNTFHTWLTGLAINDDFNIISYIIGSEADAFGAFRFVFTVGFLIVAVSGLVAYLYKMKFNEYIDAFYNGMKKMFKPILFLFAVYFIFGISYVSPIAPTIANWFANLVEGFNPFIASIVAFVTSIFQIDFGYIAYTIGGLITSTYAANIDIAYTVFTSIYGLVQIFLPTSALLVVGLALTKVDYKDWLKYIWMFVVGLLVILLVLFTVVTYI